VTRLPGHALSSRDRERPREEALRGAARLDLLLPEPAPPRARE
jgi:hypothetical protein